MQLAFDFFLPEDLNAKYSAANFITSSCNENAVNFLQNYQPQDANFPQIFALTAPQMGGKTHLCHIWQQKFNAEFLKPADLENANLIKKIRAKHFYIFEDVHLLQDENLLLQIFNLAQEKSAFLLLTSKIDLPKINCKITDLKSRLNNVFTLKISNPDDNLIKMLLIKKFAEKQLQIHDDVVDFLVKNADRSYAAIANIVKMLEFYATEQKRKITPRFAKEILNKL